MNTLTKILGGIAIVGASLLPMKANAQNINCNINSTIASSYLDNGFSFNDNPTILLTGSSAAKLGNYSINFIGIHSRDIKNHFNGKISWVEWTGMFDISQNNGITTNSLGAYYSFLPEDIFKIDGINGVYGSIETNTNPLIKIYMERGFKNINGIRGKVKTSGSTNIFNKKVSASFEISAMNNYFIKKKGLHHLCFDLNSEILSSGPLKLSAGLKYQKGIGNQAVTGLQGQLSADYTF